LEQDPICPDEVKAFGDHRTACAREGQTVEDKGKRRRIMKISRETPT